MPVEIADESIVAALQSSMPDLTAVYLFGSRAEGMDGPDSDLDLAISTDNPRDAVALWECGQRLAAQFGCEVDLLDLGTASTVMQYQIVTKGRLLWKRDAQAALYESFILSEKLALDAARAGLMEDIAREGRVYGR